MTGLRVLVDITKRKLVEKALHESEDKFRNLVETSSDWIWEINVNFAYTYVSPNIRDLLGYEPEEIIGKTPFDLMPSEEAERVNNVVADIMVKRQPFKCIENRNIHKDGHLIVLETSGVPFFNSEGTFCGYRGIDRDITERTLAEEALRKSEETARRLAQENAIMAEIGRTISSTLNVEEVYERFSEEVSKLIPFDRIAINIVNIEEDSFTIAYAMGTEILNRRQGDKIPLVSTITEEILRTRSSLLIQIENKAELIERFPALLPNFQAGYRSMMSIPLISKDQVIGVLHFRSTKPSAYTEMDLKLAERVGNQIAGAIANAYLFSEHKQTEEALSESEEKFRVMSSTAADAILLADNKGKIAYWNPAAEKMFGFTSEEALGMNLHLLLAPERYHGNYQKGWDKFRKTGQGPAIGNKLEFFALRKDGTEFPIEISTSAIQMGGEWGAIGIIRDITERKQAEEALRRSEEAAKRIAQENAIVAEIGRIISSSLNIDEVYERFAEEVKTFIPFDRIAVSILNDNENSLTFAYVSGIEIPERGKGESLPLKSLQLNEQVVHSRSGVLFQTEDEKELMDRFPSVLPTFKVGLRSMMSVPLISKDKVIGILHLRSTKPTAYSERDLRLAERVGYQIAGAIANAQLFTEHQRMEEVLRKSEEKFQKLFDEAPVGYMELDTEGCIAQVNRTELTLLGYTAEEMLGQPVWKFVVEEEKARQTVMAKLSGSMQPGKAFERIYKRKDGTTLTVLIEDGFIHDEAGRVTGIHSIFQDITERKQAEREMEVLQEQLRQSQKMEAIGLLAGGIAHDFNNLLTVIKGYSQLSLTELREGDPLKENIKEIQKASQRAADLTRQLLAFSRRQILDFKVLDLNTIVQDLDKMLRRILGEDIELVTLLADNLWKVKTDPGQMEQVLLNLAVNARDAMPSGGILRIETDNVALNEKYTHIHLGVSPGPYVLLSVSDTGCGMSPEVKEKIFEPFFTTKELGKGTGLGLSTLYGIVKQCGGSIWVDSQPGLGATFKIYLPREEEARDLHPEEETGTTSRGNETVLLVEDEPSLLGLAARILRTQGYHVLEATNGEEALHIAQEQARKRIHLLLTDVVMPQMGGRELADRIKILKPDIKVLYTSGYTDHAIVHQGVLDPGTNFLQKPFSPMALSHKVREVLER